MTHPPCLRLCPAYPGNPRFRIEGESPLQGKDIRSTEAARRAATPVPLSHLLGAQKVGQQIPDFPATTPADRQRNPLLNSVQPRSRDEAYPSGEGRGMAVAVTPSSGPGFKRRA